MAAAQVSFGYDDESGSAWSLDAASFGVASLALHNDRGSDFDATLVDPGEVSIAPESTLAIDQAVPATYGRATLSLAPSSALYSYSFQLTLNGDVYIVRSTEPLTVEARCGAPVTTTPSSVLDVAVIVTIDGLIALMDGANLPSTMGTPMVLDDTTAPALISSVSDWLVGAVTADCAIDDPDL